MFNIESDKTINVTRGDILSFTVGTKDKDTGEEYIFGSGDIVRFTVYGKRDTENVVLQKDFVVTEPTEKLLLFFSKEETRIGEPINKATDYWYEVELNPDFRPQTIIGYDENGAKVFRLFPEGIDINAPAEIDPEDIPVIDEELDSLSPRPVQNKAIAGAVMKLIERITKLENEVMLLKGDEKEGESE